MLKKIISGGQTGADRAALDFAIEIGIPHGGRVPKGRKAEDGEIPAKYKLQEMKTLSYPARTKQNVLDSHGTLIISHGELTGGSLRTMKVAEEHKRPLLHIDLTKTNPFIAAGKIINWIVGNRIEILNVAGPRSSKDPNIYEETLKVLKASYHMATVNEELPDPQRISPVLPITIEEALQILESKMNLKERTHLARMPEEELIYIHPTFGAYIRDGFGLSSGNGALLESCSSASGKVLSEDEASFLIIKKLWEKFKPRYSLQVTEKDTPHEMRELLVSPERESGWAKTSMRVHLGFYKAMRPYQGKELKTSEIKKILSTIPSLARQAQFMQPPDHCLNYKNNPGACPCAMTEKAIFERVGRGLYRVRSGI